MHITAGDVADLAAGATLLGSGGGGETTNAAAMLRHVLTAYGPVELVRATELDPDSWVVPVACIGAISVMVERPPSGPEFGAALRELERHLGVEVAAVHGLEAAGANALIPVAAAAWSGLPLVDADGMGRAFPGLHQTVFNLAGLPSAPVVLSEPSGAKVIIADTDGAGAERLARAALPALGGWAATAGFAMRAEDSDRHALAGTIGFALTLGRALRRAQQDPADRDKLLAEASGQRLFTGTVLQVRQRGRGGATHGTVTVEHAVTRERTMRLEMADEYLLALDDGAVTARVPDIIAVLHARTWHPISTEEVAPGQHVDVLRLPAPAALETPEAAALIGPAAFGLDLLGDGRDAPDGGRR